MLLKRRTAGTKELPGHTPLPSPALGTGPLLSPRVHPSSPDKGMPWGLEVILPRESGRAIIIFFVTFCELKDWVQWYKTSLSWDLRAGSVGSWFSSPSVDFPASFSSAEMGHQLQLVGVTLLGVAMTACERAGRGTRERAALAQHHMGSRQQHHSRGSSISPAGVGSAGRWAPGVTGEDGGGSGGGAGEVAARPRSWRGSHGNVQASLQ